MARAGSMNAPGPFNFRGCGLTAECLLAREMARVRFPAAAPIFLQAARQHAAESPKLSSLRAARRQPAIFILGSWQTSNALALQASLMWERYPPTPPISTAGNSTNAQR